MDAIKLGVEVVFATSDPMAARAEAEAMLEQRIREGKIYSYEVIGPVEVATTIPDVVPDGVVSPA